MPNALINVVIDIFRGNYQVFNKVCQYLSLNFLIYMYLT